MLLDDYRPKPMLVTQDHQVLSPKYPVIDAHNHLGDEFGGGWIHRPVSELIDTLNEAGVRVYVDLDGGWGEDILDAHLAHFKEGAPERFQVFGGVNWQAWADQGNLFGEWAAKRFREQAARGAQGLKIWKGFGLRVKDHQGHLVGVDDPRLDPIWETVAELKLPVLIHVADPVAFFQPLDRYNERWEELLAHPDWHFPSPPYPSFISIVEGLANLVQRHPKTTFIGAHVGCYAENLGWVGNLLDRCSNFYVDIGARIPELGRQPYTARQFVLRYADRIVFGSDYGPNLEAYRIMYRFLETADEYFNYTPGDLPSEGRWQIYGLYLPDDILEKIYCRNAEKILQL
jgi:predicted TIM-barrel fold metal-dependent hydrolase